MKKPFMKSLLLGMSVDEFVEKILEQEDGIFEEYETVCSNDARKASWWSELIKQLIKAKDKNIKFVYDDDGEDSAVYCPKLDIEALEYTYEDWGAAENDCRIMNRFIDDFYGAKKKKPVAVVTQAQYLKKRGHCPACKSKNTRQDGGYYSGNKGMVTCTIGCDKCNAQWTETYELTGFKDLGSR